MAAMALWKNSILSPTGAQQMFGITFDGIKFEVVRLALLAEYGRVMSLAGFTQVTNWTSAELKKIRNCWKRIKSTKHWSELAAVQNAQEMEVCSFSLDPTTRQSHLY